MPNRSPAAVSDVNLVGQDGQPPSEISASAPPQPAPPRTPIDFGVSFTPAAPGPFSRVVYVEANNERLGALAVEGTATASAGGQAPISSPAANTGTGSSASPRNAAVDEAYRALDALSARARALPKNDANEALGAERDEVVKGIRDLRIHIENLDGAGLAPSDLKRIKSSLYEAIQKLAPSYYQGYEANILKSDKSKALRFRTCSYSSLAMALESMGKTAADYTGNWDMLLAVDAYPGYDTRLRAAQDQVKQNPSGEAPRDRSRLLGLRLPDFLQLVMVAERASGPSPAAITRAAEAAWKVTGGSVDHGMKLALWGTSASESCSSRVKESSRGLPPLPCRGRNHHLCRRRLQKQGGSAEKSDFEG